MTAKRFIQNKSLEEDSIVISDGVIDRENDRILRYDKEYCDLLNALHEENNQLKERNEFLKKQLDRVCIDNEEMGDKLKKIGRIL
jgi:hypothetical protein